MNFLRASNTQELGKLKPSGARILTVPVDVSLEKMLRETMKDTEI